MTNQRIVAIAAFVSLVSAVPRGATAQDATTATPTRMEIGGSIAFIQAMPTGGPRFTFNFNARHAIQTGADLRFRQDSYGWEAGALYTVEYRYTLPIRLQATRVFLTAGGVGSLEWYHQDARTYTFNGASYVNLAGQLVIVPPSEYHAPAYSDFGGLPPVYPIVGGGFEYRLNSRLLVRADAQVIMFIDEGLYPVPRVSGGLVVSLGKRVR